MRVLLRKPVFLLLLLFMLTSAITLRVAAQDDPNTPAVNDIYYDDEVTGTITDSAFWDWWHVSAAAGEQMVIYMGGTGGLAPLVGILDPSGDLVASSNNGEANSDVQLEYTVPSNGEYTIVTTRVDNADGTTTGGYALRLRRANPPVDTNSDRYQDVTFMCKDTEVTTAATIIFSEDVVPDMSYRITVYGVDGFQPVARINFDAKNAQPFEFCRDTADNTTLTDTFTLPGEDARTVTNDNLSSTAQLLVTGADQAGPITLTIASRGGAPGRYMAIVEGFAIEPKNDVDNVEVRVGPLAAKTTSITTYMVATPNSRLDPYMGLPVSGIECDDAGRDTCDQIPSFNHAGAVLHEGSGLTLEGDRSDAGLLINPGNPDSQLLELTSRSGETHGGYALVFIGELPPRNP